MAQTMGFVQSLNIGSSTQQCVWIGTSPTNVEVLLIQVAAGDDAATIAFKSQMLDAFSAALISRTTVLANHGDQDSIITSMTINPQ